MSAAARCAGDPRDATVWIFAAWCRGRSLHARLEDHVEGRFGCAADVVETSFVEHVGEPLLPSLRTERESDFLCL